VSSPGAESLFFPWNCLKFVNIEKGTSVSVLANLAWSTD